MLRYLTFFKTNIWGRLKTYMLIATLLIASCPIAFGANVNAAPPSGLDYSDLINGGFQSALNDSVTFTKAAEATYGADGYVDITLTAVGSIPTPEDVYVAMVFSRSSSMNTSVWPFTPYTKYQRACYDMKTFASSIYSNPNINGHVGVVKVGTAADAPYGFDTNLDLVCNDFTGSETFGQSSNLQAGIAQAASMLDSAPAGAYKYVVVFSDGATNACQGGWLTGVWPPTLNCYNTVGDVQNSFGNPWANLTAPGYNYAGATVNVANDASNRGIAVLTIGYEPNAAAAGTLADIGLGGYYAASATNFGNIFAGIAPAMAQLPAGYEAIATDQIGTGFEFVYGSDNVYYNGETRTVTCYLYDIVENGTSCTFQIRAVEVNTCLPDTPVDVWLDTNGEAGAVLGFLAPVDYDYIELPPITDSPQYHWFAETFAGNFYCGGWINITKYVADNNPDDEIDLPANWADRLFSFRVTINGIDGVYDGTYSIDGGWDKNYTEPFMVQASHSQPTSIFLPNRYLVSTVLVKEVEFLNPSQYILVDSDYDYNSFGDENESTNWWFLNHFMPLTTPTPFSSCLIAGKTNLLANDPNCKASLTVPYAGYLSMSHPSTSLTATASMTANDAMVAAVVALATITALTVSLRLASRSSFPLRRDR